MTALSRRSRVGYALGGIASGTYGTVPGLILMPFLTDLLGVEAAIAGMIVFAPKAWDFFLNPIAGRISDRSRHPHDRRRPFILRAGILLALAFAAMFFGPAAPPVAAAEPAPVETPAPAAAEPAPAAATAPAPAEAAATPPALKDPVAWTVQKGSTLTFAATWSADTIQGQFTAWTADILFSPDALDRSKLTVAIDMTSAKTGDDQRDASLPSDDFFAAAAHPKAIFTATKFRKTGEGRFVADGTLDLRGVKKPLSLPFSLKIDGDMATARGVTTLDRTAFGVGQGEWASTDQIGGKVKVSFALTAKRK